MLFDLTVADFTEMSDSAGITAADCKRLIKEKVLLGAGHSGNGFPSASSSTSSAKMKSKGSQKKKKKRKKKT